MYSAVYASVVLAQSTGVDGCRRDTVITATTGSTRHLALRHEQQLTPSQPGLARSDEFINGRSFRTFEIIMFAVGDYYAPFCSAGRSY